MIADRSVPPPQFARKPTTSETIVISRKTAVKLARYSASYRGSESGSNARARPSVDSASSISARYPPVSINLAVERTEAG